MAKAGLASGFSTLVNPYSLTGPDFSAGLGALQDTAADAAMMRSRMTQTVSDMSGLLPMVEAPQQPAATQAPTSSAILYNPASKEFAVAGQRIASDDATKLLQSESLIGQTAPPGTDLGPGWEPVTTESYQRIIEGIKNPSFGAMVGRGFEIGKQNLKTLYGSALQSVTGGEYGGGMVKSAETELAKLQPYQRDVAEGITADWFATTLGQQGPMLLESVITALAGAAAGSAAAPGAGTVLGGLAGVLGRKAAKQKIIDAATKYNTAKAAGIAVNSTEELRQATKVLKNAGAVAGAVAGSALGNQVIAAGDIYSEGGTPAESWLYGVPYAALDTLVDFAIVSRALGGGRAALPSGATLGQRATEYGVKRFGAGLAVGGLAEGATETGQEAIVLQATEQEMDSPEAINRFLNSFAAGFAVGGLMGGAANLRSRPDTKEETNLLDNPPPQELLALPPPATPSPTSPLALSAPPTPEVLALPAPQLALPAPPAAIPLGGPLAPDYWQQGTLDLFPDAGRAELAQRAQPATAPIALEAPQTAAVANPAQGILQFAPPAPARGGVGNVGQLLLRERDYPLAQAQQEAQQAQQLAQDFPLAQAQQQLQRATESELRGWDAAGSTGLLPTVEARPTQATQLELPVVRQQARPTRAEKLKRGARPAAPTPEVVPATPQELEAAGQMRLFDDEGQTTVAAAKGAGLKRKRPKPKVETGAKQAPPTGKKVDLTVAAKKRAEEAKKAEAEAAAKKAEEEAVTVTAEEEALDAEIQEIEETLLGLEADGKKQPTIKYVKELYKRGVISEASLNDAQAASKDRDFGVDDIVSAIRSDINDYETEKRNALQKQGADEVSARKGTGTGEEVGPEVRRTEEPPGARKLKPKAKAKKPAAKPVPEEQVAEQVEEEVTPAKKSEAAPAAATEEPVSEKVVAEPSEPVMIQFSLNGDTMTADGREMLRVTNEQLDKYKALLNCLKG